MLKHVIALFLYILAAFYITYPLAFHLGDFATGLGDELVISWIQNWVIHSVLTGNILNIFDANLYYPYHNTLAFSDLHLTTSLLAIIPLLIINQPIVTFNFTVISSLFLVGFSLYLLSYYLTKDYFASLLSGLLVVFSPAFLDKFTHIQIFSVQWVPLAILFFLLFLDTKKIKFLCISLVFFLLQTYNSFLPGYFIIFSYVIIFLYYFLKQRKKIRGVVTKRSIIVFAAAFLLLIPIIIPYYSVSNEFRYVRDIRDAIHYAMQPEDLLYPSIHTRLYDYLLLLPTNQYSQNSEFQPGYLGAIFSILFLFVLFNFIKYIKKNSLMHAFVIISLTGLIVSLGPALHLGRQTIHYPFPIPLPYVIFYYLVPGFQGLRNSARWEILFIICIAVAIAIVISKLLKKASLRMRLLLYCLLFIGIIAEFNFPMKFYSIPQTRDFPKVYSWLATTEVDSKILQLPIYNWGMWPYTQQELWREYYGTVHFRKTVNGYTGFSPPPWQEIVMTLYKEFPNKNSLTIIRDLGIDYIVIDKSDYDTLYKDNQIEKNGDNILDELHKNTSIKFVKRVENHFIFKVLR